jgi:hypothetical protein
MPNIAILLHMNSIVIKNINNSYRCKSTSYTVTFEYRPPGGSFVEIIDPPIHLISRENEDLMLKKNNKINYQ